MAMSVAVHIFMPDPYEEEPYRRFLGDVQNLFGTWKITGSKFFSTGPTIHDCFIGSEDLPPGENVRVNVSASRRHEAIIWGFDHQWYISFETSAGRAPLSYAVQFGALLLAARKFRWNVAVDRDTYIEAKEPQEFRTLESLIAHVRRVLGRMQYCADLQQQGVLNENYEPVLPLHTSDR
jgi:hypothetical protein